jgi:hypothetical protein
VLGSYRTGTSLLRYVVRTMPYGSPRSLPDEDYRDVTTYLLDSLGFRVDPNNFKRGSDTLRALQPLE